MIRLAIVGDIGCGKSYVAKQFGYPVFNADAEVSKLYKTSRKCFNKLKIALPNYINSFPIKKNNLSKAILANKHNMKKIIKIVHPEVRSKMDSFIKKNRKKRIIVLDIPLLIENVTFQNGKTFAPTQDENIVFELLTNRNIEFNVQIFDLNGKYLNTAEQIESESLIWSWDGLKSNGEMVPFGIYILYFIADSGEVSHKEAVVVIK